MSQHFASNRPKSKLYNQLHSSWSRRKRSDLSASHALIKTTFLQTFIQPICYAVKGLMGIVKNLKTWIAIIKNLNIQLYGGISQKRKIILPRVLIYVYCCILLHRLKNC